MFEKFINKNRKLAIILFTVLVVLVVVVFLYFLTSQNRESEADVLERQASDLKESQETAYSNSLYTISDRRRDKNIITIDANAGYRNAAINKLYDLGFDPTDFTIRFNNYESTFTPYE